MYFLFCLIFLIIILKSLWNEILDLGCLVVWVGCEVRDGWRWNHRLYLCDELLAEGDLAEFVSHLRENLSSILIVNWEDAYSEEVKEVGLIWTFPGLLEDSLDHIVAVLVKHDILEGLSIGHQGFEEQGLRLRRVIKFHSAFYYVRWYLLSAVIGYSAADELSDLDIDLFVVILQNLLDNIVSILIVNKLVKLTETHIHERAPYLRMRGP